MAAWPKPLDGVEVSAPLPTGKNEDGKSLAALRPDKPSPMYERFPAPLNVDSGNAFECVKASAECSDARGFHVMFRHTDEDETRHAHALHERIRREFPELRIYRVFEQPIGPHSTGMFGALSRAVSRLTLAEVNTFTPTQTGALFGFLTVYRGPLSGAFAPGDFADLQCSSTRTRARTSAITSIAHHGWDSPGPSAGQHSSASTASMALYRTPRPVTRRGA